jgi:hypothetical protein
VGSILQDFTALREMNLLNIPTITLVDGSLRFYGGGATFPIFCKSYAHSRLFLLKSVFSLFFSFSFFSRFKVLFKKFKNRKKMKFFRIS